MIGALVEGRICIAAGGISVARSALTIAVRWGERRRQFGTGLDMDTPLMDYLTHQRRLLPAICTSYALQAAHDHLTASYVEVLGKSDLDQPAGVEQREVEALAAGIKAVATWHMVEAVQQSRECCGGKGYLAENRFAALRADADVFVTFEGDNTVLMQLVAKTLLSDYASQFEDLDAVGMVRHLTTRQVSRVLGDLGRTLRSTGDLRSREWQAQALAFREQRLVDALARRLRTLVKEGTDPLRGLSTCQDHALAAARAHIERVVHEQFAEGRAVRPAAARRRTRPGGPVGDRAGPRVVARARFPVPGHQQGTAEAGQRAVRRPASAGSHPRRGLRHPRRAASRPTATKAQAGGAGTD